MAKTTYDESKILTLSALEHIRKRPGMYIGRLGNGTHVDDGIYILLKEVVDNSIDEFIMGYGSRIVIRLKESEVSVRDFGRGIPLGKVVDCVSIINTGAKYSDDVFQFSVGLNGVGTKAVNALSSHFQVTSYREGKYSTAIFEKGILIREKTGKTEEADGTEVLFTPDPELFGEYSYNEDFVISRIWSYAYLNTGLTINYNNRAYKSSNGLYDLLDKEVGTENLYSIIHYQSKQLEFALTHVTGSYGENYFSYVNGQHTNDGGTHQSAFKEGILKGINEYFKKNWAPQDVREGVVGAIAVKIKEPVFESQTKNKLSNTEIRTWIVNEVKDAIIDFLLKNTAEAEKINQKILNNEKLRKELNEVKKGARESAKKVSLNIPKLKDCKYHLGQSNAHQEACESSMIFLTEGDSASGTITKTRDVMTQAVFSLRGKIVNVFGKKKTEIYKNAELYNMMVALGIENGVEGLRYGKVIIATDADTDGFHIRNLLMTYFLTYFEDLVLSGRLYILETPLFRVRNKTQTVYCYSEKERDHATSQIRNSEVTRFKGLGEIDPKEFGQFIGEDMRLLPVSIVGMNEMHKTMEFYMGSNTPERRDFIMENLI
ncbi:DNA topoisomerase IV subunit B [Sphaerochaeta halotolerans]|jgi:topoisomerase-4 subunit B|uniref:DNA topoisomerase (ATP-hydrolyzing) n=1 Tax=Sphaerochaeta halotolerans TaxID=2293840 RepID=A0A372MJZ8_9SPIR|nr:DNA topoisomerase IV subunit B [Sphaerochaeta halotolerans]MBG0767924.1 type IIA DNA topoisomerase subunit B [Spirochaetaceae bacterium]MDN5333722.1 topoisomerase subunit [Sphaerochaeta sp.]MXI86905.1 type IIA DNA topoisomerase subunit B [Sphaerochaeta halotolerans]RFU96127.1 type IIA DNA topoisomerase subunit B [Sphaerochaeta halotolerans]